MWRKINSLNPFINYKLISMTKNNVLGKGGEKGLESVV